MQKPWISRLHAPAPKTVSEASVLSWRSMAVIVASSKALGSKNVPSQVSENVGYKLP
jgi:hypothetical protein